jgi:hypothetical protein
MTVISIVGSYDITFVTSETSMLLDRDSLDSSDAINQALATNHIRFDCKGDVLHLFVNGLQRNQQTGSEYLIGNIGLIAVI